jgi:hypothetical protein
MYIFQLGQNILAVFGSDAEFLRKLEWLLFSGTHYHEIQSEKWTGKA